jgi:hypothetical protein
MNFERIAPYLQDPLVLVGFIFFVASLTGRQLLRSGIIQPLPPRPGFRILRLLLSYGFVLALVVILLGFGLKYRELSRAEQHAAVRLIAEELAANAAVLTELGKNADTLTNAAIVFSSVVRDPRFQILRGLFPDENLDPLLDEGTLTNLYNERIDWLSASGLLKSKDETRRLTEACAAVGRSYGRMIPTVRSLADESGERYRLSRAAWDEQLSIARKITVVDVATLSQLYEQMSRARATYGRIASIVPEYLRNIDAFCRELPPTRDSLSPTLATERLTFRLLPAFRSQLTKLVGEATASAAHLRAGTAG